MRRISRQRSDIIFNPKEEIKMEIYKDLDGNSGVYGYEINDTSITVWFKRISKSYTYSYQSAGQQHVEQMKKLAQIGNGLNAFINSHVKYNYVR